MARLVDASKMARIQQATMELVVERGYGGASISSIASKAGVAEGYLYRFYSSKQELVNALLFLKVNRLIIKLNELLEQFSDIRMVLHLLIGELFMMAETVPDEVRFIHVLMHDYNFQISTSQREEIRILCEKVIVTGVRSGDLNAVLTTEEVYSMGIIYPLEFINMRIKGFFGTYRWSEPEKKRVIEFCLNALK